MFVVLKYPSNEKSGDHIKILSLRTLQPYFERKNFKMDQRKKNLQVIWQYNMHQANKI